MIDSNSGLTSSFKLQTSSLIWGQANVILLEFSNFHVQIISILLQVGVDHDISSIFIIKQLTQGGPMQVKQQKVRNYLWMRALVDPCRQAIQMSKN